MLSAFPGSKAPTDFFTRCWFAVSDVAGAAKA
jgi:hypothetical protein